MINFFFLVCYNGPHFQKDIIRTIIFRDYLFNVTGLCQAKEHWCTEVLPGLLNLATIFSPWNSDSSCHYRNHIRARDTVSNGKTLPGTERQVDFLKLFSHKLNLGDSEEFLRIVLNLPRGRRNTTLTLSWTTYIIEFPQGFQEGLYYVRSCRRWHFTNHQDEKVTLKLRQSWKILCLHFVYMKSVI